MTQRCLNSMCWPDLALRQNQNKEKAALSHQGGFGVRFVPDIIVIVPGYDVDRCFEWASPASFLVIVIGA